MSAKTYSWTDILQRDGIYTPVSNNGALLLSSGGFVLWLSVRIFVAQPAYARSWSNYSFTESGADELEKIIIKTEKELFIRGKSEQAVSPGYD